MSLCIKAIWIVPLLALQVKFLPAGEAGRSFQPTLLKPIHCQVQVPAGWSVYDQPGQSDCSWVITPDDLSKSHYVTGVKIDSLAHVKKLMGAKASKWVADRVKDKSGSLPVVSAETGSTNDYFQVTRLVTKEVYSPGRTEYTTYRKIYSWYWNDRHDVVICIEAGTPDKSWKSMSSILEKIGRLNFDVAAWKKRLTVTEE